MAQGQQARGLQATLTRLCNMAMMTGGREQCRDSFPLSALLHLIRVEAQLPRPSKEAPPVLVRVSKTDGAKALDFSGNGAFLAYATLMKEESVYTTTMAGLSEQIVFCAMFGTYVEDLGRPS